VPASGSPVAPTFDVSFEPPVAASLTTTTAPPAAEAQPFFPATPAETSTGTPSTGTSQPLALTPPLPGLSSVGIVQTPPKVAAPTPAAIAPLPAAAPVARTVVTGRSRRDLALLVFLLADAMFYLGWLSRGGRSGDRAQRLSIYDLPPAADA
jgi:hypothetical protein